MKVRITKGIGWYEGLEGEIFEVTEVQSNSLGLVYEVKEQRERYEANNHQGWVGIIKPEDCEIVKEEETIRQTLFYKDETAEYFRLMADWIQAGAIEVQAFHVDRGVCPQRKETHFLYKPTGSYTLTLRYTMKLEPTTIDLDGLPAVCGDCGQELTFVRPGKYQCDNEGCSSNGGNS